MGLLSSLPQQPGPTQFKLSDKDQLAKEGPKSLKFFHWLSKRDYVGFREVTPIMESTREHVGYKG